MAKKKAVKKRASKKDPAIKDWRSLPRKPAETKRACTVAIRVTSEKRAAMNAAAKAAGQTLVDYILARCLRENEG